MSEDPLETARERATRRWRNNWIQRRTEVQPEIQPNIEEEKLLNQGRRKLITAIDKIFNEHKHTLTLQYYKLAIGSRRRRLLEEKLRRLESKHE